MTKQLTQWLSLTLLSCLSLGAYAQNKPVTNRHVFEGITFSHKSTTTSFTLQVEKYELTHQEGDFILYDSAGRRRLLMVVPTRRTKFELAALRIINPLGIVVSRYSISTDLEERFGKVAATASFRCPLNIVINRSTGMITNVKTSCDELAISQTEDLRG